MASASPENIKQWKFPKAEFIQNLTGHNAVINGLACNSDNVLVSGGKPLIQIFHSQENEPIWYQLSLIIQADNGSLFFWDWLTGYNFQRIQSAAQSGSIDSEAGILAMTFDQSGSRLLTCEADKTIKIYKEDEEAVRVNNSSSINRHFVNLIISFKTEETHPINWKPDLLKRKRF